MALQTKKILKKMVSWAGLFFFVLAAYMLYRQLSKYSWTDIKDALLGIPPHNLWMACLASIRYRLYTRWRFHGGEIVRMVTFSGFTYLVACFFLIIVGYVITPSHAFGAGSVSKLTTEVVTLGSVIGLAVYFGLSLFYKKPLMVKGVVFEMPPFRMALAQVFIGAADILMASLVLYFSLIPFVDISFATFIGVFIIAQVLGVFSQVPGGLGVFEGLFMYIIPGDHNQAMLFGALLAYRIIYYLLPMVVSAVMLFSYEGYLKYVKKQRLEKLKIVNTAQMNRNKI